MSTPIITIRLYNPEDWKMVKSWWDIQNEFAPLETMMPLNSSFIAEIDEVPALAVCLYLTNTPEVAYVENFVGNPELKGTSRKEATNILLNHITKFAFEMGYKRLLCMSEKPILKAHYEKIGFTKTLDGVATFIKETKCHH